MRVCCGVVPAVALFCGATVRADANGLCVKASNYGWNATNATAAVQAAIDSGAKKVVIDRQAGDWIVDPIFLRRSNQDIVVADGVTIRAKKGGFRGIADHLFAMKGVSNVVLRGEGTARLVMNKKDYQDVGEYKFSEWRHAIYIAGGHDITVKDLVILSSGGDGVYVRDAARNVRLDRLVCCDHHRQGISVISAINLHVTRCRFDDTSGTAPQCGLDIEPNGPRDVLENILFEDCVFSGNADSGIMAHLFPLDDTTRPISIVFRRCVSRGNGNCGFRINCVGQNGRRKSVRGTIDIEDCLTGRNKSHALLVSKKRSDAIAISVKSCKFDARGTKAAAVMFDNASFLAEFGGCSFDNVTVLAGDGMPVAFDGSGVVGIDANTVSGHISVVKPNGVSETLALKDFARRHRTNGDLLKAMADFNTMPLEHGKLRPMPGAERLAKPSSTGWMASRFVFVQHVPAAGDYPISFRVEPVGKNPEASAKVKVYDAAGTDLGSFSLPTGVTTHVIHANVAGIRRFEVRRSRRTKVSVESVWPGHGIEADIRVPIFGGRNRRYWFTVPSDAESVSVQVEPEEPCSARLLRADGSVAAQMPLASKLTLLDAKREKSAEAESWSVEFTKVVEDAAFRIGAPALPIVSTDPRAIMR